MSESKSSELVSSAPVDEERDAKFDIVDEVGRHFLQSDSSRLIDEWIEKHCSSFDQQTEEHSLEHTTLHEEFKTLYEDIVESYIIAKGSTSVEFYKLISESSDCSNRQSSSSLIGDILLATFDFDVFVTMMRDSSRSLLISNPK